MNSLNSSFVDVGAGTVIAGVERKREVGTDAAGAGRTDVDTLTTDINLRLTNEDVVVFDSEGTALLEREDFWEILADPKELAATSLLTTL